jgi:hypothetical protein
MAGKERSIQIVDADGNVKITLDGDNAGIKSAQDRVISDLWEQGFNLNSGMVSTVFRTITEGVWKTKYGVGVVTASGGANADINVAVITPGMGIASGTLQFSGDISLSAAPVTNVQGTLLSAGATKCYPGDSLALVVAGTLTGLTGGFTVGMERVE